MNDIIRLNVGGTSFMTIRATLTSSTESLLAKMFSLDSDLPPARVTEDGAYFIDASPRGFAVILDWLRYRKILLGSDTKPEDLIHVAEYFALNDLRDALEDHLATSKPRGLVKLNVGGTMFETDESILKGDPNSKLCKMLIKGGKYIDPPVRLTEDGICHIAVDPRAFSVILNWLRCREIILGDISREEEVIPVAESLGLNSKKFESALRRAIAELDCNCNW